MKKIKFFILVLISIISISCNNQNNKDSNYEQSNNYYIFDTPDYFDYNKENNVLYIKSHKQLVEIDNNLINEKRVLDSIDVFNALGHFVTIYENYTNPEIVTNPSEDNYNITMHLHPLTDSIIINVSDLDIESLYLSRCYMLEKSITSNGKSIFEFIDYLDIPIQVNDSILHLYSFCTNDISDIDFDNGERLILEYVYDSILYSIPVPYQLLLE